MTVRLESPVLIIGDLADTIATPAQTLDLAHHALNAQLWLIPLEAENTVTASKIQKLNVSAPIRSLLLGP